MTCNTARDTASSRGQDYGIMPQWVLKVKVRLPCSQVPWSPYWWQLSGLRGRCWCPCISSSSASASASKGGLTSALISPIDCLSSPVLAFQAPLDAVRVWHSSNETNGSGKGALEGSSFAVCQKGCACQTAASRADRLGSSSPPCVERHAACVPPVQAFWQCPHGDGEELRYHLRRCGWRGSGVRVSAGHDGKP